MLSTQQTLRIMVSKCVYVFFCLSCLLSSYFVLFLFSSSYLIVFVRKCAHRSQRIFYGMNNKELEREIEEERRKKFIQTATINSIFVFLVCFMTMKIFSLLVGFTLHRTFRVVVWFLILRAYKIFPFSTPVQIVCGLRVQACG